MLLDVADERLDGDDGNDKRAHAADAQNQQLLAREGQAELEHLDQARARHRRHGEEEAEKAREASKALFSGQGSLDNMPNHQLAEADFNEEGMIDILAVLQKSGLAPSRAEARRNVEQGGVSINGDQVKDIKKTFTKDDFGGDGMIVKRGKKNFMKVTL